MEINFKDIKILGELLDNCRQSNKQIGLKVGLSREGVANRIRNLEEKGIIQKYITEIDSSKLGYTNYAFTIKFNGNGKLFENFLKKQKEIAFVERTIGRYNYLVVVKIKNTFELKNLVRNLKIFAGDKLSEFEISISVANYDMQSSFFRNSIEIVIKKDEDKIYNLKELDKKLLKQLGLNSKISVVDLAGKLSVSAVTITEKIKTLKKEGIIKNFRILIDYKKLNLNRYTFAINLNPEFEEELLKFCRKTKNIIDVSEVIGKYNYTLEILAEDNNKFRDIIEELNKKMFGKIIDSNSLIILEEIEHNLQK